MIFAPTYTRHERTVVRRLRLLGLDHERTNCPRHEFRDGLRERLVAEATGRHDDRVAC
jgi:hypothetical protein